MTASGQDIPMVESDRTWRLAKRHRLYGRERAVASLMESFGRICRGQGEVVLVPGYSGVGKTFLVQEIQGSVKKQNGFFLQGKFNQYQRNIPYFAIRQALAQLALELQSESEPLRRQWKSVLQQAVGNLGRLLIDLAPELELLLGPLPLVAEISPVETRHRFARVLRNFFDAVCRLEHPVVLFIDDWQWADPASFELLNQLRIGTTLRYLLVIAPYRDNEVDPAHPLIAMVEELRRQAVPVNVIEVGNLGAADVLAWVKDVLQPAAENPEGLAELIHSRTKGNPFFTQASLTFLEDFGLLRFDDGRGCWRWKIEATGENGLPGDIVELFRLRLSRLDQESRDLLSQAACLGARFDLDSLAVISRQSPEKRRSLLLPLCDQELVAPVEPANDVVRDGHIPGDDAPGDEALQWFMFVHDRVQQAAYGLIPPEVLPSVRLEIGRLLLTRLGPEMLADRLFEVTDHLNIGQLLIESPAEQVQLVGLNVAAARKARAAAAYGAALQFHRAAGRVVANPAFVESLWNNQHELALSLFLEWAESEFLEGDRTEAERHIEQAAAHARTPIEKAEALNILIVQNTLRARYPEAIAAGRQALSALGIILPEEGYEAARLAEIDLVRRSLGQRSVASLVGLPVMSQPEMRMAVAILITMGPPCYRSHQRLWGVIVPKVVNLTLEYGVIEQVGYSHPAFAGLLCWTANDFALAREFGELANRLMTDVFHSPTDRSVYALMIGSSVRHWFHHLKRGSEDYAEACEIGLQSGNLQYTAYAFGHNMYCRFYQGVALGDLIQESQRSLAFSRTRLNQWAIDLLQGGLRIFSSLSGSEGEIGGASLPEADYLQEVEQRRNIQVTCIYKILKTFSLLVLGRYDEALAMSDQVEPILYTVGMQGLLPWPEHIFARFLILSALTAAEDEKLQARRRAELLQILAKLRLWADYCPENFEHMHRLAAAELARIDSCPAKAMILYEQAIEEARAGGFVQWEGVANERAARFWREQGASSLTQMYWQQAYSCFERWGGAAKLQAIETEYLQWLAAGLPQPPDSADLPVQQARNALLERQVRLFRSQALQSAEIRIRAEMERQAGELTHATEHLRAEVAERKRVEEELRLHREQLEERVRERTTALETSLTERRLAEEALRRLNRELRAISNCNQALIRAEDEQTLFDNVCGIVCDEAGYRMACVAYAENDDAKTIRPVAWAGVEEGYLEQARLTWADTERGRGPGGTAIRSGETACIQDFAAAPQASPWRGDALQRGYRSVVALPLKDNGANTFGILAIYSMEPNAFTPAEIRLLEELAGDLSFGVMVLRARILHKRAEEEIAELNRELHRRLEAQEEARKELETISYSVSHDLKIPLRAINGFVAIMREEYKPQLAGEGERYLNVVHKNTVRMGWLIDGLLDFISLSQRDMRMTTVNMGALALEVFEVLRATEPKRHISLCVGDLPPAHGDRDMISRVLKNFFRNAIKFTAPQAKALIEIGCAATDKENAYFVRDNGVGFDMRYVDKLFGVGSKLHSPDEFEGAGIGLAVVKRIINRHGGRVWADSKIGGGAAFHFTLPCAQ
jgi:predicted ATPase/signal transduction histidine kinase